MKTKSKPKYKAVWTCDFCGQEFDTKKESDKHELTCEKNPESNEIVYTFRAPKHTTLILGFLIIYFLVYLVVSSYAQTNGLREKQFLNPLGWFASEVGETMIYNPAPVLEITPTPKPKPKVQAKNTNTTNNTNNGQIDCIGPDGKQFKTTMAECKSLNEKWGKTVDYLTNCNYPAECGGGTKYIKYSECMKPCTRINANTNNIQQNNNSNLGPVKINCSWHSGEYNYDYGTLTYDECKVKSDAYWASKKVNIPTTAQPQAVVDTKKDYTAICNAQYQIDIQKAKMYGGNVGDAVKDIANSNLSYCLKTGIVQNNNIQPNIPSPTPTIVGIWYGNLGPL